MKPLKVGSVGTYINDFFRFYEMTNTRISKNFAQSLVGVNCPTAELGCGQTAKEVYENNSIQRKWLNKLFVVISEEEETGTLLAVYDHDDKFYLYTLQPKETKC